MINKATDRLLVLNYPAGAGGKLIGLVLALHPHFLHQHHYLAERKMRDHWDQDRSFRVSHGVLAIKRRSGRHFELGSQMLAGFLKNRDGDDDERLANPTWRRLCDQHRYWFAAEQHSQHDGFRDYPNSRQVILTNYEWILALRGLPPHTKQFRRSAERVWRFDAATIREQRAFLGEIERLAQWLDLGHLRADLVEQLRLAFMATISVGFEPGGAWRQQLDLDRD